MAQSDVQENGKIERCATDDNNNDRIKQLEQKDNNPGKKVVIGKTVKGIICAFLWPLVFATSRICVQALENKIEHLTLNGLRYLVPCIGVGIFLGITRQTPKVKREDVKALLVYSVILNFASLTSYVPAVYIPLASVEAVYMCTTLFAAALSFGFIIKSLRSTTKSVEILAAVFSAVGVVLVLQPWQDGFRPLLYILLIYYY